MVTYIKRVYTPFFISESNSQLTMDGIVLSLIFVFPLNDKSGISFSVNENPFISFRPLPMLFLKTAIYCMVKIWIFCFLLIAEVKVPQYNTG